MVVNEVNIIPRPAAKLKLLGHEKPVRVSDLDIKAPLRGVLFRTGVRQISVMNNYFATLMETKPSGFRIFPESFSGNLALYEQTILNHPTVPPEGFGKREVKGNGIYR